MRLLHLQPDNVLLCRLGLPPSRSSACRKSVALSHAQSAAAAVRLMAGSWQRRGVTLAWQVRASRNLPLGLMMAEYERILKRRLRAVGGSPDDPALHEMLQAFK